uniref:Ground-like domain-containing protein n=1 Tax=Panagrolaimus sp. JU765 TaxID=591449 RepID=A0AC34Q931_9BILA
MISKTLLIVAIIPMASAIFFGGGGGGGCGCAPPPPPPCPPPPPPCLPPPPQLCLPPLPPPPQLCLPRIQPPCLPQLPPLSLPSLPSPCGCGRKKRETPAPTVRGQSGVSSDSLCNNQTIRKIILKNLNEDPALSKAAIHSEVKARLGGEYIVVCSQGSFSFIADTHNYCIDGSNNQTCYVFQA